jgi:hypothetical protein
MEGDADASKSVALTVDREAVRTSLPAAETTSGAGLSLTTCWSQKSLAVTAGDDTVIGGPLDGRWKVGTRLSLSAAATP